MKQNKLIPVCLSIAIILLAACNKGMNDYFYKGDNLPIAFKGYNSSTEILRVKLDTNAVIPPINGGSPFEFTSAYTFFGDKNSVKLTVTEENTGKLVLEKELKKEDGPAKLNFLYMDGKVSDWPEKPATEADKLKIIYMFMPQITNYSGPVDIVFFKYYITPQVFEEQARISNLKPYEFSKPAVFPTFSVARQEYNGVMTSASFVVRIFKAGTNTLYTDGTGYIWNALNSTAPKPPASTGSSKLYIFQEQPAGTTIRFYNRLEQ